MKKKAKKRSPPRKAPSTTSILHNNIHKELVVMAKVTVLLADEMRGRGAPFPISNEDMAILHDLINEKPNG